MEDKFASSPFANMMNLTYEFEYDYTNHPWGCIIMPTTYESKLKGRFIIAVNCDQKFTLKQKD